MKDFCFSYVLFSRVNILKRLFVGLKKNILIMNRNKTVKNNFAALLNDVCTYYF